MQHGYLRSDPQETEPRNDQSHFHYLWPLVTLKLQNVEIESKKPMNVLGVTFDCKLNWQAHTAMAVSKVKKSLYALRLLRQFFNNNEMRTLLDSHFYSSLYLNDIGRNKRSSLS